MSNVFYNELWLSIQKDVVKLQLTDNHLQENNNPRAKDVALNEILPIYLRYRNIVNRLILCYDGIIQNQKKELIKRLLNCCIGRMLEYKKEIVKLNCSEYEWPDDLLIKMKWTPDDIQVSPPSSYVADREDQLKERRNFINNLIKMAEDSQLVEKVESNLGNLQYNLISNNIKVNQSLSTFGKQEQKIIHPLQNDSFRKISDSMIEQAEDCFDERAEERFAKAILMIQNHKRARVGRKIAVQIEMENEYKRKLNLGEIEFKHVKKENILKAVITIQKYWRGYLVRKHMKKRLNKVEELLGMSIPSWKDNSIFLNDHENLKKRQKLQPKALDQIFEDINREKSQIIENKREILMEDTIDEIREWFAFWYSEVGYFGIYPSSNDGGSVLITTENVPTPQEFVSQQSEKMLGQEKNKDKLEDKKKLEKKKSQNQDFWIMPKSKVLEVLKEVNQEFFSNWSGKDDSKYLDHTTNINLIKDQIYCDFHLETRKIVDDLMTLELKRLNIALIKDHKKDKEKFKIPGLKKGKKKKAKKKNKLKKNNEESNEELNKIFAELVSAKIIKNYTEVKLNEWIGDFSYQNYEAKNKNENYQYRLGDIKQAILDYCILPLGSKDMHSVAPLVRSVCIVGQPFSGKKFLANAICSEVGALLFDLTPTTLAGQYEGKANEKNLMKMIKTLAKAYPPVIILIDGGDKPWWKKIPPEEKLTQPKRLTKLLPNFIKSIKPGDQILVLGLASEPWKSKKQFYKIYDKFIILPLSDYNSLYVFYNQILMKYHEIDRNIDISSLTKATIGYPLGVIHEAIENVLNIKRRMTLEFQPLRGEEILTELMKWESPSQKDIKKIERFENKTPLGKKRIKMLKKV